MAFKRIFLCILLFQVICGYAQDRQRQYVGAEALFIAYNGEVADVANIRKSVTANQYDYNSTGYSLNTLSYYTSFGAHTEYIIASDKMSFVCGLRFTEINNSIQHNSAWTNQTFFYYRYKQDSTRTDYVKVSRIQQKTQYLGIPLELKYYWFRRHYMISPYVIAGTEIRYRMQSSTRFTMYESAMSIYEQELLPKVTKPSNSHITFYAGIGAKIGRPDKPSILFEANLPFLFLPSTSFGMVQPKAGGGIRLSAQFPLKSN